MDSNAKSSSPFDNEWLECQIANYIHAARSNENLEGAQEVLKLAQLGQDDIDNIYIKATMRSDAGEKIMSVIEAKQKMQEVKHESSCTCAVCTQGQ